jgi:hypothetical protein
MEPTFPEIAPLEAAKTTGRPPYLPSDEDRGKVSLMNSLGIPQSQIALLLGIAPKTLRKHFRKELDLSAIEANCHVLTSLFEMATSRRSAAAAIFWAKTRCGYRAAGPSQDTGKKPQLSSNYPSGQPLPELIVYNNDGEPNHHA